MFNLSQEFYLKWLEEIMQKYDLEGSFLHHTYREGMKRGDLSACYVDDHVKNANRLRFELDSLIEAYLTDNPKAKKPAYS